MHKFVVIGGMYRSGTTLTETVVGSHPEISIPPRDFHFFMYYKDGVSMQDVYNGLDKMKVWERLEEEIKRKIKGQGEKLPDFSEGFSGTPQEAFTRPLISYAQAIQKSIPGVKCPGFEFNFESIADWLSNYDLKFIHLIRNPFDMVASFQNSSYYPDVVKNNPANIGVHARNWCRSVALALARTRNHPENYYLIKYEDLAENPHHETKKLCDFLEVEFAENKMLNAEDFDYYGANTSFGSQSRSDEKKFIKKPESRKKFLTDLQIKIISSTCGEQAKIIGYQDQDFICAPQEPFSAKRSIFKKVAQRLVRE